MKKLRDFINRYREHGEAEEEFEISLWHIIIPIGLIIMAIIIFS